MITITCDNRLRVPLTGPGALPADAAQELRLAVTFENPQAKKLVAMGYKYNSEPKFYELWKHDHGQLTIPRGALDTLREIIGARGLEYEVIDKRTKGDAQTTGSYADPWHLQPGVKFPPHTKVLWDHQRGIVDAIIKYEQALIRSPTGSGKTSALTAAIAEISLPSLVIMWDTGLLKQWQTRIAEELSIPIDQQGLIQGKTCRLRGITLAMQQTLNQYSDQQWSQLEGVFGFVACDEVQRYAASTFTKQIDRLACKYRVGVSADERRKDGKQFLIYSMFGQVRHDVDRKDLIAKRLIHEVEVYVVPTEFRADWYRPDPEDRDSKKIQMPNFGRLLDEMQADPQRNALAANLINECVQAGLPTLVFTHRVDHAMIIDRMVAARGVRSGLALGGTDWSDQFDQTIAGLRDGSLDVGCGTFGKLGVGHDIPTVAAGVTVTPVHNNKPFLGQVKGRICRTSAGKDNARIIILWDQYVFGEVPLFNLRKWNEVMRVWCTWDRRWKDVSVYLKESRHGRGNATAHAAETETGIFSSANAR